MSIVKLSKLGNLEKQQITIVLKGMEGIAICRHFTDNNNKHKICTMLLRAALDQIVYNLQIILFSYQ